MATEKLPMLQEGYDKLFSELKALREERPRVVDAIEDARMAIFRKMPNITPQKSVRARSKRRLPILRTS